MKVICVVQARMDSSRFPGKVLADLAGYPILEHVVRRCEASGLPVVVATTDREVDDPIAAWAVAAGVKVFRWNGPVDDVLRRYIACADAYEADAIVRVTGDSPLVPVESVVTVSGHLSARVKIVAMTSRLGVTPDGMEVEGCQVELLRMLEGSLPSAYEHEHVFPGIYRLVGAPGGISFPQSLVPREVLPSPWHVAGLLQQRFSVDTPEDLAWLNVLAKHLDFTPPEPSVENLISLLSEHPALQRPLMERTK